MFRVLGVYNFALASKMSLVKKMQALYYIDQGVFDTIEALILLFDPFKKKISCSFWFKWEQKNLLLKFINFYSLLLQNIDENLSIFHAIKGNLD